MRGGVDLLSTKWQVALEDLEGESRHVFLKPLSTPRRFLRLREDSLQMEEGKSPFRG